jgi:hypothetical protein
MDYCEELVRISNNLFDGNEKVLNLLSKLSNIGIIAGGSVVYALNSFVPKESVGDIDVFVNKENDIMNCIELIYEKFPNCEKIVYNFETLQNDNYSIVIIKILENCPPIQIILYKFISHIELLEGFDIDYVGCGIHNNKLYITKDCIKSHNERKILKVRTSIKYERLLKATRKGFKCIIFKRERTKYYKNPIEVIKTIEELRNINWSFFSNVEYFDEEQQNAPFVLTDSAIVKTVEVGGKKEGTDENNNIFIFRYKTFTYLTFETEDVFQIDIKIKLFSYYVNIQKIDNEDSVILIEDDLFLTKRKLVYEMFNRNFFLENHDEQFLILKNSFPLGENILLVSPYYESLESQDLSGAIKNIEDLNENILPIYAAFNYEVIGHEFEFESESYNKVLNIKSCKK